MRHLRERNIDLPQEQTILLFSLHFLALAWILRVSLNIERPRALMTFWTITRPIMARSKI
jgi:hypothetical protein